MHSNDYYDKFTAYQEAIDILENDDAKTNDAKVHLAYYACFLYMKHLLNLFFRNEPHIKQTREKIQSAYNRELKGGSHVALFLMFRNFMAYAEVYDTQERMILNSDFEFLKTARTNASYKPRQVSDAEMEEALYTMNDIITELKELEKVIKGCFNRRELDKFSNCNFISKNKWEFSIKNNQTISFKPI